jgi:dTDP-4-dehydrorhamnose 3,5-epimerase
MVLENDTVLAYKVDNYYSLENDKGLAFDDPTIGIDWHIDADLLQLSDKDTRQPLLSDADLFDYNVNYYV